MTYTKNNLQTGDTITKAALDNMENGIAANDAILSGKELDGTWAVVNTDNGSALTVRGAAEGFSDLLQAWETVDGVSVLASMHRFLGGAWLDMSTTGPSGVGSGGAGTDVWIARAASSGQYFSDAATGDLVGRAPAGGHYRLGTADGSPTSTVAISHVGVEIASAPTIASHATRKDYVDSVGTSGGDANSIARRDGAGDSAFNQVVLNASAPFLSQHSTRKDYVDAGDNWATVLFDDFTRADNSTSVGTAPIGGAPALTQGTWGISGERGGLYVADASAQDYLCWDTHTADLVAEAEFYLPGSVYNVGFTLRAVDASNSLVVAFRNDGAGNNDIHVYSQVAGVFTSLGTVANPIAAPGSVRVKAALAGDSVTVYVSDVSRLAVSGLNALGGGIPTATKHGLYMYGSQSSAAIRMIGRVQLRTL